MRETSTADRTEAYLASREALDFVREVWAEAVEAGIDPDLLANAALFTAFSQLVETYGEDAVGRLASGFAERIQAGELSLGRSIQ